MSDYIPQIPEYERTGELVTFQDAVDQVLTYYSRPNAGRDAMLARKAVTNALSDLSTGPHLWKWYTGDYQFTTSPAYDTGTITYDHTGGAVERLLTLAGGTWPADADWGRVMINSMPYMVSKRLGDTTVQLRADSNPGADVAAGATYAWVRDTYPCPPDLWRTAGLIDCGLMTGGPDVAYAEPETVLALTRSFRGMSFAYPQLMTITKDIRRAVQCVVFSMPPSTARTYQAVYRRSVRPLVTLKFSVGTIDTTINSTTINGSGMTWDSRHVGCVLRISENGSQEPTSLFGNTTPSGQGNAQVFQNPATCTRIVMSVDAADEITVDAPVPFTATGRKYTLSDPIDVDWMICSVAFQRMCELQMAEMCMDFKELRDGRRRVADEELAGAQYADKRDSDTSRAKRALWTGLGLWSMTFNATNIGGA